MTMVLLLLERSRLRDDVLLCLDEATANVDPANDARIQRVLGTEFAAQSAAPVSRPFCASVRPWTVSSEQPASCSSRASSMVRCASSKTRILHVTWLGLELGSGVGVGLGLGLGFGLGLGLRLGFARWSRPCDRAISPLYLAYISPLWPRSVCCSRPVSVLHTLV